VQHLVIRYSINYHVCNMNCPYCIAKRQETKENPFNIEDFRTILAKIEELPYNVCLRIGTMGEIFTSQEILEEIKNICRKDNNIFGVNFSSNIYTDWEKVIKPFLDSVKTQKLGMGCTLHDMVLKDVDTFFKKVEKIKKSGVLVYVGYVAVPQMIPHIGEYKKKCDRIGVPLILNSLLGQLKGVDGADTGKRYPRDYSHNELQQLKDLWDTPHSYKMLVEACSPRGMQCSAGKNFIFIDNNGDVFPCRGIKKTIGNIANGKIKFKKKDTTCPCVRCWCGNQNQALRIVDKYYHRTRNPRIFYPRKEIPIEQLYRGYNHSIFSNRFSW
jgi:MoaA/NifB/PqqE/SkfB family radical SAM enzyme